LGHSLASKIEHPEKLLIAVGALPKNVCYAPTDGAGNYALSWSVDGLVNEYIRPCSVRLDGVEQQVDALLGLQHVLLNGVKYEAAFTSGGIGSLIKELPHVPNVYYKTLRYPGHYEYVQEVVARHGRDHAAIKQEFLQVFPFCTDDIIVVYGECTGKSASSQLRKESFAAKFTGVEGLSAIQSTTAGGGVAILELMLKNKLSGIVNHADIPLSAFTSTETYRQTYSLVQ
jgi:saccharopine dehydrogenase-like NADP-dependent oxidoreductase